MSTVRVRFVGADGLSFFDNIDASQWRTIYKRFAPDDVDFSLDSVPFGQVPSRKIEVYRREVWHIPIGPLACPIDGGDEDARFDAVYRLED